ncbi:MAG: hypothetical protein F6K24_12165, partial [Okeania sp. SIO2D1]|nr:hypothetical protein [Okeania sp. SIO2D1]
ERPILVEDEPAILPEPVKYVLPGGSAESVNSNNSSSDQAPTDYEQTKLNNREDKSSNETTNIQKSPDEEAPTLEEIEEKILTFCSSQKTTVRQVQQKFSKYKLTAETIWKMFQGFADKNLGTVAVKKVGGSVSRSFSPTTPDQHPDV